MLSVPVVVSKKKAFPAQHVISPGLRYGNTAHSQRPGHFPRIKAAILMEKPPFMELYAHALPGQHFIGFYRGSMDESGLEVIFSPFKASPPEPPNPVIGFYDLKLRAVF